MRYNMALSGSLPEDFMAVIEITPVDGATNVSPSTTIEIVFNHPVNASTTSKIYVICNNRSIACTKSVVQDVVTLTPTTTLPVNSRIDVYVNDVEGTLGEVMTAPFTSYFMTGNFTGSFTFRIDLAEYYASPDYTLPLGDSDAYTFNFIVDWGDGSTGAVTSYGDINATHTYATEDTYDITITGECGFFGNKSTDYHYIDEITHLLTMTANPNLQVLRMTNANNLIYIDSSFNEFFIDATDLYRNFLYCYSLEEIPSDLFVNCTNIIDFTQCFLGCYSTALTSIPSGLFDDCTEVTSFYGCFDACNYLTTIPSGLFDNCTKVTDFGSCFNDCELLETIPSGLFDNCTKVIYFDNCFNNCIGLTGAAMPLINTAIANATTNGITLVTTDCFSGCTNLSDYSSIPSAWGGGGS